MTTSIKTMTMTTTMTPKTTSAVIYDVGDGVWKSGVGKKER